MSDDTATRTGWLAPHELESVRGQVPLVYVDAIPVRDAIRHKYRVVTLLLIVSDLFRKLLRRAEAPECAILLRFD